MDRTLLGCLVVLVGVILLLQNIGPEMGIGHVSFGRLWPAVLIVYGLATMMRSRRGDHDLVVGGLITAVGAVFLAETLFGIHLWRQIGSVVRDFWPVALIVFGGYLVLKGRGES